MATQMVGLQTLGLHSIADGKGWPNMGSEDLSQETKWEYNYERLGTLNLNCTDKTCRCRRVRYRKGDVKLSPVNPGCD